MTKKKTTPHQAPEERPNPKGSWVCPPDENHWIHLTLEQRDALHNLMLSHWVPQLNTISHYLLRTSIQVYCRSHMGKRSRWFVIEQDGSFTDE